MKLIRDIFVRHSFVAPRPVVIVVTSSTPPQVGMRA